MYAMKNHSLVDQGLARWYRGRLIPIMQGGSDADDEPLFPAVPDDFSTLSDEDLQTFIDATADQLAEVSADPAAFASDDVPMGDLLAAARSAGEALVGARDELARRQEAAVEEAPADEDLTAEFAALADLAAAADDTDPPADPPADEPVEDAVTASVETPADPPAPAAPRRLPVPSRSRSVPERTEQRVALTAAGQFPGFDKGDAFPSMESIADAMIARRRNFGLIPDGTAGEKIPIVRANWAELYPSERKLGEDAFANQRLIEAATGPAVVNAEFAKRKAGALTASGGLCAPVTPYYQLQMISVADRPVRAALPSFNADRGGLRFARPAALSAVTTAVGVRTATQDAAGGTTAQKTCQVIPCPSFTETDVEIIFHCLQFGNLGARTFPELVTQWNNLVLAAHARLAESELLTAIDAASTAVTAGNLGLGASASLPGQIMVAADAMRSRHRMRPDAVLRVLLPFWVIDQMVDDVIRGQFQRFDTNYERVIALLRQWNVEPSFYIDGAGGAGQVFGTQNAGSLLEFPTTARWYIFPEGSFIFLDGGTLELGIVRDSVLNKSNDFQIFGESFEAVSFVGVESMAVTSTVCDNGRVSLPVAVTCPITY